MYKALLENLSVANLYLGNIHSANIMQLQVAQ